MRKLISLTFMLISFGASSQELSDCVNQASLYGVDLAAPKINDSCKNVIVNNASSTSIAYSSDNYIQAFGAGNIIHVLFHTQDLNGNPVLSLSGLTSGRYTGLNQIKALDIDEVNKMVYALNTASDGSVNVVSVQADKDGALAARAKLYTGEISGAVNIKTDRVNGDLFVMGSNWIKVFNIDAHHKSSIPEQSIGVKRAIAGNNTELSDVKDLVVINEEVYVLESNRVLVFPRVNNSSDVAPKTILASNLPATSVAIEYKDNMLVVQDQSGSITKISI